VCARCTIATAIGSVDGPGSRGCSLDAQARRNRRPSLSPHACQRRPGPPRADLPARKPSGRVRSNVQRTPKPRSCARRTDLTGTPAADRTPG
jgi:hypothetical protein